MRWAAEVARSLQHRRLPGDKCRLCIRGLEHLRRVLPKPKVPFPWNRDDGIRVCWERLQGSSGGHTFVRLDDTNRLQDVCLDDMGSVRSPVWRWPDQPPPHDLESSQKWWKSLPHVQQGNQGMQRLPLLRCKELHAGRVGSMGNMRYRLRHRPERAQTCHLPAQVRRWHWLHGRSHTERTLWGGIHQSMPGD